MIKWGLFMKLVYIINSIILLMPVIGINAMEIKPEWVVKEENIITNRLRQDKITPKQAILEKEILKKKALVIGMHANYIQSLQKNQPDAVKFYYNKYADYVENYNDDFGQGLANPYAIIAKSICDDSVKQMLNLVNGAWPINGKNAIGYWQNEDANKVITYSYTNPAGYAILCNNQAMLKALIDLGINCRASARRQGNHYTTINIPDVMSEMSYNAFDYAIFKEQPDCAQLIYDQDPAIVCESNSLKIAFEIVCKSKKTDRISFFEFVHNFVYKHKETIDHSLLKTACIDYGDAQLAAKLLALGYKADVAFNWFGSTTAEQVLKMFKNIAKVKFDAECVAKLVVTLKREKAFNKKQKEKLKKLIDERIMLLTDPHLNSSKECQVANLIKSKSMNACAVKDESL